MRKVVCVSVRGSAHKTNGLPCQDFSSTARAGIEKDTIICALADGAGSSKFATEGAEISCQVSLDYFARQLSDHPHPGQLISKYDRSDGDSLISTQQKRLRAFATERETDISDFSTTLLVAVIHDEASLFFQIGDGCWSISRAGVIGAVTWPLKGEYVGQTDFITSPTAVDSYQLTLVDGPIEFVVGLTDGLERLALDMQRYVPNPKFFDPLAKGCVTEPDAEVFKAALMQFLDSDRVCERTDDDKSLTIVTA